MWGEKLYIHPRQRPQIAAAVVANPAAVAAVAAASDADKGLRDRIYKNQKETARTIRPLSCGAGCLLDESQICTNKKKGTATGPVLVDLSGIVRSRAPNEQSSLQQQHCLSIPSSSSNYSSSSRRRGRHTNIKRREPRSDCLDECLSSEELVAVSLAVFIKETEGLRVEWSVGSSL